MWMKNVFERNDLVFFLYYQWTTLKHITYILKQNRFNRHLVDISTDEKKVVIYKALNRVTDFDELTKLIPTNFSNIFIAKEKEQVCSIFFETKEKDIFL